MRTEEKTAVFPLLLKPASFDCNLRCGYCFYLPKEKMFGGGRHSMTFETLETVIRRYSECGFDRGSFGWQGGEPTLMGEDFFREAVRLQKKYMPGAAVENALQTNGVNIDREWCGFLRENNFLVGVSIDGPERLHNRFRKYAGGGGSHAGVMRGVSLLRDEHVEFNALTLVSAANQEHPEEVYDYLKEQGAFYHQYIDCVEFDEKGGLRPFSLTPGKWGEFLCRVFDRWYPEDAGKVSVRLFDSIVSRLVRGAPTICPMCPDCRNYLVVEHDGSVYPCDFNVRPELLLGNVNTSGFQEMRASSAYAKWGKRKKPVSAECLSCRYMPLCMGDCQKNRSAGKSVLCGDWQMFYDHTIERFEVLAAAIDRAASGSD